MKMIHKKYITLAAVGILASVAVFSQGKRKQEVSVWGAGGLSALNYDLNTGTNEKNMGGAFGIGYNYFFNEKWSIGSGFELAFYNSGISLESISDKYNTNDGEYDFTFHTAISKYRETQNVALLNIPLVAQFQIPVIKENQFYVSGGFKLGLPVSKRVKVKDAFLDNYGYYPQWDNPIKDDPYFMGFGMFRRQNEKANLDLKAAFMLTLDTGIKWKLSDAMSLYTGAYLDYGLNNIKKDSNKRLIEYNTENPADFIHNSALISEYTNDNGETIVIAKSVKPIATGIKLRVAFGL